MDPTKLLETSKNLMNRTVRFGRKLGPGNLFFFGSLGFAMFVM